MSITSITPKLYANAKQRSNPIKIVCRNLSEMFQRRGEAKGFKLMDKLAMHSHDN